jgi:Tol biopolymer transport system component
VAADESTHEVEAEATNLLPGTKYEVTLVGENAGGATTRETAGPTSFTTPAIPPVIISSSATQIGATGATISAKIDPGGAPTSFRVEYGPTSSYGFSTAEIGPIGSDNSIHEVAVELGPLLPEAAYHWRVVASNAAGPTNGPDQTLRTFGEAVPSSSLPDGRAYEQVTGPEKGGLAIGGFVSSTFASPDGDAITFFTLGTLPGSEGAQNFGTYLSTRGGSAWQTTGLLPPSNLGREGKVKGVTEDLSTSYTSAFDPSSSTNGLYERDTASRLTSLIARAPRPMNVAATTPTGSRMLLETSESLTPGTTPGVHNLYVWDRSGRTIHLADAMNDAEEPTEGAFAGPEGEAARNSRFVPEALTPDGENVVFTAVTDGQLYLRRHVLAQQSQLNGQEECTEAVKACTIEVSMSQATAPDPFGPQIAHLVGVSDAEDPAIFFTSRGRLTDDANTGPADESEDLYRYDSADGVLTDLTPDAPDPAGAQVIGVPGIATDGASGYFVANAVLGDGAAHGAAPGDCNPEFQQFGQGECNLYYWSDTGHMAFVGRLDAEGERSSDQFDWVSRSNSRELGREYSSRVSPDGSSLVFRSQHQQTTSPIGGVPNFYRYDAATDSVQCITCDPSGAEQPGEPTLFSWTATSGGFEKFVPGLNLVGAGNRFYFESGARLAPDDINGEGGCPEVPAISGELVPRCQDVYEWEGKGIGSCRRDEQAGGCLFLISSGTSPTPSFFASADSSGANVFIFTDQRLVSQDRDDATDIYDARVDGGLAGQNQPPAVPCETPGACRSTASGSPATSSPATATFAGTGNPVEMKPPSCKKGFKKARRHGKEVCVKAKRPKKKGASRRHHKAARHHHKHGHPHTGGAK